MDFMKATYPAAVHDKSFFLREKKEKLWDKTCDGFSSKLMKALLMRDFCLFCSLRNHWWKKCDEQE